MMCVQMAHLLQCEGGGQRITLRVVSSHTLTCFLGTNLNWSNLCNKALLPPDPYCWPNKCIVSVHFKLAYDCRGKNNLSLIWLENINWNKNLEIRFKLGKIKGKGYNYKNWNEWNCVEMRTPCVYKYTSVKTVSDENNNYNSLKEEK